MEIWLRLDLTRRSSFFVDSLTATRGEGNNLSEYHASISRLAL